MQNNLNSVFRSFGEFQVVTAHPDMIMYVDSLQRKNAEALSFYPKCVFEREVANKRLFLGLLNGDPCGYLYVGAAGGDVKLHQVCIQYDARRRLYGACLVKCVEDYASGSFSITLRCGFDLEANKFWKDMGFSCVDVQDGGIRRMRKINVWRKILTDELFSFDSVEPACGVVDSSIWRRNRKTGIINQFARGKAMIEYRNHVISKDSK